MSTEQNTVSDTERVIKKYPNRRLYDTSASAYITLAEVKQLIMQHEPVVVRDAKSGQDLTRAILLQIILEEEAAGVPMFSEAMLANIIRFYGHAMQSHMGSYIEKNVQMFTDFQQKMQIPQIPQMPHMPPMSPTMLPAGYAEQMQKFQEKLQEQMRQQTEQMMNIFGLKR